jgi:hypothetical protein
MVPERSLSRFAAAWAPGLDLDQELFRAMLIKSTVIEVNEVGANMFRSILVPVDGSAYAHKAVEIAGDLALKYGARVTVLHVLRPDPIGIGPEKFRALVGAERIGAASPALPSA